MTVKGQSDSQFYPPDIANDFVHLLTIIKIIVLFLLLHHLLGCYLVSNLATLGVVLNGPQNVAGSSYLQTTYHEDKN